MKAAAAASSRPVPAKSLRVLSLAAVLLACSAAPGLAATKYFSGDGGNNFWGTDGCWGTASGLHDGTVPGAGDAVVFDNASSNCTMDVATAQCLTIDFTGGTGYANTFDLNGNSLKVSGTTFKLVAGMTFTPNGGMVDLVAIAGTVTVTTAGQVLYNLRVGNAGNGASYEMQDDLDIANNLTQNAGVFKTNGHALDIGNDYLQTSATTGTLALGASQVTVGHDFTWLKTSFLAAGTSTVTMTGAKGNHKIGCSGLQRDADFYNLYLGANGTTTTVDAGDDILRVGHQLTTGSGTISGARVPLTHAEVMDCFDPDPALTMNASLSLRWYNTGGSETVNLNPCTYNGNIYFYRKDQFGNNVNLSLTADIDMAGTLFVEDINADAQNSRMINFNGHNLTVGSFSITTRPAMYTLNIGTSTFWVKGNANIIGKKSNETEQHIAHISAGGVWKIDGNLTFTTTAWGSGQGNILLADGATIQVGGNWNDSVMPANMFADTNGAVELNGPADQSVTTGAAEILPTFKVNKSVGTPTALSDFTVGGDLTLTTGTFSVGTRTIAVTGTTSGSGTIEILTGTLDANGNYDMNGGSTTFTGSGRLELGGTVASLGVLTAPLGTVSYDSGANQSVQAATYYDLEVDKSAGTATTSGTVLCGGAVNLLAGTLDLSAGTMLKTDGGIMSSATSTFKVSGTLGSHVTIQEKTAAQYYGVALAGNVNVNYADISSLGSAGLTLSGSGVTVAFNNSTFSAGEDAAEPYMKITGDAWNGYNFQSLTFNTSGARYSAGITTGSQVLMSPYAGTLTGDATDLDSDGDPVAGGYSGHIRWMPTAADGLDASIEQVEKGVLVRWTAPIERGTLGYRVLRRERAGNVQQSSSTVQRSTAKAGPGQWRELAVVSAAAFGGEPTGNEYRWLDVSAADEGSVAPCEYRVEEIEAGGEQPRVARAAVLDG